jgi:hypothetical protein
MVKWPRATERAPRHNSGSDAVAALDPTARKVVWTYDVRRATRRLGLTHTAGSGMGSLHFRELQ